MQTSHAEYRKTHKGFSNTKTTPQAKSKDKKDRSQRLNSEKHEIQIIKDAENRYEDLKKLEALLRIHAQANSPHQEIYKGLYIISKKEKRDSEATSWARKWITYPPKNAEDGIMKSRLANRLKELDSLKRITKSLINLNQEKAAISIQWCIKHLIIAEEWEEAYKSIKRLKKIKPDLEAIKALEAMCIFETIKITQKERVTRINKLELEKNTQNSRQTTIIKLRALYEKGIDPKILIESINTEKVNRHGIGVERLLVPILMAASQTQQAIEICKKMLCTNPSSKKLREVYGECLLRQGKWRTGFIEKTANLKNTNTLTKKGDIKIFCDGTLGETLFYSRWLSYTTKNHSKRLYMLSSRC